MKCIACIHLDLKKYPTYSAIGLGNCKVDPAPAAFWPITNEHDCGTFEQAAVGTVLKREAWWAGRQ